MVEKKCKSCNFRFEKNLDPQEEFCDKCYLKLNEAPKEIFHGKHGDYEIVQKRRFFLSKRLQNIVICPILNRTLTAGACSSLAYWKRCPICPKTGKKVHLKWCINCKNKCDNYLKIRS